MSEADEKLDEIITHQKQIVKRLDDVIQVQIEWSAYEESDYKTIEDFEKQRNIIRESIRILENLKSGERRKWIYEYEGFEELDEMILNKGG